MKIKNVKLYWFVMNYNSNRNKVEPYNIFGKDYPQIIAKNIKSHKITNREDLKNFVEQDLKYHYWSKSEFELAVGGLFTDYEDLEKIDIWTQLKENIDIIVDYIILKMQIKF